MGTDSFQVCNLSSQYRSFVSPPNWQRLNSLLRLNRDQNSIHKNHIEKRAQRRRVVVLEFHTLSSILMRERILEQELVEIHTI